MLHVTSTAKEKLREALEYENIEDGTLIRIAFSSEKPSKMGFVLDMEKSGDTVIKDDKEEKLLLVGSEIEPVISDKVIDYKDVGNSGMQFTIKEKGN